jgi:hypothetical protein
MYRFPRVARIAAGAQRRQAQKRGEPSSRRWITGSLSPSRQHAAEHLLPRHRALLVLLGAAAALAVTPRTTSAATTAGSRSASSSSPTPASFERPSEGRQWFELMLRDQLVLERPDNAQSVFAPKITRRTPGRFRTRVIGDGVEPQIQAHYEHSKVKQYFKEGRALRTETTINDPEDSASAGR